MKYSNKRYTKRDTLEVSRTLMVLHRNLRYTLLDSLLGYTVSHYLRSETHSILYI